MQDYDDDDSERDDDEGGSLRRRNRQDGNRQDGNRRQRGNNRQGGVDLASDNSAAWRFVKNMLAMFANDIGRRGYDIGWIQTFFEALERIFGESVTGTLLFPGIAALIQNPAILKTAIRNAGAPPQVNALIDEMLDDLIEGLRQAYVQRGRLNQGDAGRVAAQVQDKFQKQAKMTYAEAVFRLTTAEQTELTQWIGTFSEEDSSKFHSCRAQLNNGHALRSLLAQQSVHRIQFLMRIYGVPASTVGRTFVDGITSTFKGMDAAVRRHIAVTDPAHDPVAQSMNQYASRVRRRRGV